MTARQVGLLGFCLMGWFATHSTTAMAEMGAALASPAFDNSIYKEGAIANTNKTFGNWNLVCADVSGLNRRFCNITTLAHDQSGKVFVGMVISTTDAGKPAAMLKVPIFVSLKDGIQIGLDSKAGKSAKKQKPTSLQILSCEPAACSSIWPLEQSDIMRLAQKGQLHIRVQLYPPDTAEHLASPDVMPKPLEVIFDGNGFAEALSASQSQ